MNTLQGLSSVKKVIGRIELWSIWSEICAQHCPGKVFGDLDLNVTEVSFTSCPLPLLFVGIVGFGGAGWSTLESTVVIVGDKGLAFVFLS